MAQVPPGRQSAESLVAVARCPTYARDDVSRAVQECLARIEGLEDLVRGKRVLLKPNLLSSTAPPEEAVNTHPEVVRAVAQQFIRDFGCRVTIGDSCGTVLPGATQRALERSGVSAVARETGAEAVNFDAAGFERVRHDGGRRLTAFNVAKPVLDAEVVVSLPKFKTHQLTNFTGAVKNMLGVIPGRGKKIVHREAPKPEAFAEALVDLFERVPARLAIMDAVVGMEGNGPNNGAPRAAGLILASLDPVALDTVAASVMGYRERDVATTRLAAARGLGVGDLDRIEISGVPLDEVRIPDWRKPLSRHAGLAYRLVPGFLARALLAHLASYRSVVDASKCVLCEECIRNCPAGALTKASGRVTCRENLCIACYCCEEVCDYDAVRVVRSPLWRSVEGLKDLLVPGRWFRRRNGSSTGPRRGESRVAN